MLYARDPGGGLSNIGGPSNNSLSFSPLSTPLLVASVFVFASHTLWSSQLALIRSRLLDSLYIGRVIESNPHHPARDLHASGSPEML